MRSPLATWLAAIPLASALSACSAAAPEDKQSSNEALTFHPSPVHPTTCGPCDSNGLQTCTNGIFESLPACSHTCPSAFPSCSSSPLGASWPALDQFVRQFGCAETGVWFNGTANNLTNHEAYALCSDTPSLERWVALNPDGLGTATPNFPAHTAPACDACLAAAVSGWTYVFFNDMTFQNEEPGCLGTGCNAPVW